MAENTLCRNAALPYPVYGVPWAMKVPLLDADGDPTASGADLDCEISKNGDTAADIAGTESDVGGGNYLLTFTAADMTANIVAGTLKTSTSGLKATNFTLYPRRLPVIASGTCQGGDTTYATLAAGTILFDNQFVGCLLVVNIDSTKQARIITSSTASNQQATVGDAFTVAPDSDDTYEIMVPEGAGIPSVDAKYVSGNATAADNLESACANYSATRGLAGTALPAAAADAAGGLPISDAGALDLDTALGKLTGALDTGVTFTKIVEMLAAFLAGKVSRSSSEGVTTLTYKKRDGSTTSFTAVCDEDDGDRASTGSLS